MGFRCQACKHPRVDEINMDCIDGTGSPAIAAKYGLSKSVVDHHRLSGHANKAINTQILAAAQGPISALAGYAIYHKANRLAKIQATVDRIELVLEARAKEYTQLVGGASGLLIPRQKSVREGDQYIVVTEEEFDVYLLREYRSSLEQAAKELGEWDITGAGNRETADQTSVTIVQNIGGGLQQAIAADPKPSSRSGGQLPLAKPSIRALAERLDGHSMQSVGGDSDAIEVPVRAVDAD